MARPAKPLLAFASGRFLKSHRIRSSSPRIFLLYNGPISAISSLAVSSRNILPRQSASRRRTQMLGLLYIMGGQKDGLSLLVLHPEEIPDIPPGVGIDSHRVSSRNRYLGHVSGFGNHQLSGFMPPGQVLGHRLVRTDSRPRKDKSLSVDL